MVFNKYNIRLFIYLAIIFTAAGAGGYFLFDEYIIPFIICLITVILFSILIIDLLNETNQKIAFFIDAIKNDDATLKFPENIKNPALKMLHSSLNKVNEFITKAKIKIEHKEHFYEALIEHSATGLLSIDETGDFEILNNAARNYIGVEYTSNIHRLKQTNKDLHQILTSIKPGETKTAKIFTENNFFHLSIKCTGIRYFEKNLKLISLHNIRFELEEKEIESWQKLFRVITHEIMNSIAPIISVSNTLAKIYLSEGNVKEPREISVKMIDDTIRGLTVIEDMSNNLMNFVNTYRKLNKIPKPEFREIKIKNWFANIEEMLNKVIDEDHIALKTYIKPGRSYFTGDENLLTQVIINLVKNAKEAISGQNTGIIKLNCYPDGPGKINFEVHDNGAGIPPENLDQLFVPFYTTKENGTGIGLSLCRQIIRLHDGEIKVASKLGQGTVFTISI